jgi:hypothetical protein
VPGVPGVLAEHAPCAGRRLGMGPESRVFTGVTGCHEHGREPRATWLNVMGKAVNPVTSRAVRRSVFASFTGTTGFHEHVRGITCKVTGRLGIREQARALRE